MQGLTPQLIPAFAKVLGEPEDQLDVETRLKVIEMVKYLAKQQPSLMEGHETLMKAVRS